MNRDRRKQNQEFTDKIRSRYEKKAAFYLGENLVYRQRQKTGLQININKNLNQLISNTFDQRMKQYEKKYYQTVAAQDRHFLLRTVEAIYRHPGEKKQLIHLLQRFGVVTQGQKEWRENNRKMSRYEEELSLLRKELQRQEEYLKKLRQQESGTQVISRVSHVVMQNIKKEIRMERMRYGRD